MNRDPRREVAPPIDLTQNMLSSGSESGYVLFVRWKSFHYFPNVVTECMILFCYSESGVAQTGTKISGVPTPGKFYQWD